MQASFAHNELQDVDDLSPCIGLEELSVAQEEAKEMGARVSTSTSMRQMRSTFEPGPIGAVANNMGLKNFSLSHENWKLIAKWSQHE